MLAAGAGGVLVIHHLLAERRRRRSAAKRACRRQSDTPQPYEPPPWVASEASLRPPPTRLHLAHLPTPSHEWRIPGVDPTVELRIKRDDWTGSETR